MKLRLSLSQKVLILVAVPIVVQWGLLFWLQRSESEADRVSDRAQHISELASALVRLRVDLLHVIMMASASKKEIGLFMAPHQGFGTVIEEDCAELARLAREDTTDRREAIDQLKKETLELLSELLEIKKSADETPNDIDGRSLLWLSVRKDFSHVLSTESSGFKLDAVAVARERQVLQAKFRREQLWITIFMACMGALTAVSALYLSRTTALRLGKVIDNAYRLVSGRPLNPMLSDGDDIAKLDKVFHEMALTLREASRKEHALVENARDAICSLDGALKFRAVNPAGEILLRYPEKDLLGQSITNFVPEAEAAKTRTFFESLKAPDGTTNSAIELQMQALAGLPIYCLLSAHWSSEEETFFVVVHDVTASRQAEQLRQEVVVMVTHDLRTPLATLQNILRGVRAGTYGQLDAKGSEYISVAKRNAERMANLVNDLLDIEKAKSGLMTLDRQEVPLNDCFTAACELASGFAEEMHVKIQASQTDLLVNADQDRVTRVLANLVSNSVKFSPPGGTVRVAARREGAFIYTAVDDQGPGIPADQLQHIFERFRQAETSSKQGKGGSGLGLTICQLIVELHGGKIWAENLPTGGSRFVFTLPAMD